MYWPRLFEIQCLLNFHYDVGCQGLEIDPCIKFCLPQSFSLSHTYDNPKVLTETVFCCFGEMRCFHNLTTEFVGSQSFISLQASCLSVLQLVRYASRTGTGRRRICKMAIFI